jgi:transcriptional regulator with XRE-family HTH domain
LGNTIREARRSRGFSQEKLAEKAELHPTYIGEVERGVKNISVDALIRIAAALKVSPGDFFDDL